jgi:hypothetical protein
VTGGGSFNVYHYIGVTNTIEKSDLTPITASIRVYTRRRLSGSEESSPRVYSELHRDIR